MRTALVIFGVILMALGAFVLVRGASVSTRRDVLKMGDVSVTTRKSHPIPRWAGAAVLVTGVVIVVAGARRSG